MARHNETGKAGEDLASTYLPTAGYRILHRNWKYHPYEIDFICVKADKTHFIEVKSRTSPRFGPPETLVTPAKLKSLMKGADQYLHFHPQVRHIQFDILAIDMYPFQEPKYFLIEDVYAW